MGIDGKRPNKPYAQKIMSVLDERMAKHTKAQPTAIDTALVVAIKPYLVIAPANSNIEYEEDDLIFQVDPENLKVGDQVILARNPAGEPIVVGKADGLDVDPTIHPAGKKLKTTVARIKAQTSTYKAPVDYKAELPSTGNVDGDTRLVKAEKGFFTWKAASSGWYQHGGDDITKLPKAGGTMTGNIVMSPGTDIILPDAPTNPTEAANKAYVDSVVVGIGSDAKYTHTENTPSATWTINHPLNKYCSVTIVDSGGSVLQAGITYTNTSQVIVTFASANSGKAYLN